MRVSAHVEVGGDGWATVWVREWPGFFLNEPSEGAALGQIAEGVTAWLRWLSAHGEDVEVPAEVTVMMAEHVRHEMPLAWGEYRALFAADRVPATTAEVETTLRRMGYMRRDTLDLLGLLPDGALAWRRTPDHEFSIGGYVEHIGRAERWYVSRIWPETPPLELGPTPLDSMHRGRALAERRLAEMSEADRARVHQVGEEWWSTRKALARYLYHERYHIRSIARIARERGITVPEGLGGWHRY